MNEYDQYRARIELVPDEALALLKNALRAEGFRRVLRKGAGTVLKFRSGTELIDEVAMTRDPDFSARLDISRFGWRDNDERFAQAHHTTLEFIVTEDNSSIVVITGWVRETVADYLHRITADLSDEHVTTSYGLPYGLYVRSIKDTLRDEGWTELPGQQRPAMAWSDWKGGEASIEVQEGATIVRVQDKDSLRARFVVNAVDSRTRVQISGDSPVRSLDFADRAAHTAFVKETAHLHL